MTTTTAPTTTINARDLRAGMVLADGRTVTEIIPGPRHTLQITTDHGLTERGSCTFAEHKANRVTVTLDSFRANR